MSYSAPSIGPSGLTIPSYNDIFQDNLSQFLNIFGANQYTGIDSQIYQLLSVISLKQSDTCESLQFSYNQSSPLTAIGAGLDIIVKLNGIARLPATNSTVILIITGTVGTVIANGVAQDVNGNQWALTPNVTIPGGGTINITATCTVPGNITAEPSTITIIATPVGGWISVNNTNPATPGQAVESDSQLRARQAISVALPSETLLAGTVAGLLATPGVTRLNVLENPTGAIDSFGNPPHSLTCVVDGTATQLAIATAIYNNRGIGCQTNNLVSGGTIAGSSTVVVTDPFTGYTMPINFINPPNYVPIYVTMNIHLLAGGTSATIIAIQTAVTDYLNSLEIGETVVFSELYGAALNARSNPDMPTFSIQLVNSGVTNPPTGTTDIPLSFYQVSEGVSANVVINSV